MNVIVAVDRNWAIGKDGDQLCYIPADLKRFQTLTSGHAVILGRKTLATFPGGRPLKNRRNLILSRDPSFAPEGAEVFRDLDSLLAAAPADAFVIGGGSVYNALLPFCDKAYITRIDRAWPADVFFPDLDADPAWRITEEGEPLEHEGLSFRYVTYERVGTCM
ncbi:dihydrofolate reductase [Intestinimonas massiliensis (ex Afouda et al. 2020)]|uniref:dihydrofolate reductase n=1 Tax=Intestinimonas massiliensis (ex Afouda et al. 2020) TaxID=1673721 RepID=UPI00102FBCA3|nr:dihydrofolate reductase [Intestinimonas massiliensis (ex Afouda et al. 2020)]